MADTFTKDVVGIVPGVLAIGLLGQSAKLALDSFPKQKASKFDFKAKANHKPLKIGYGKGPSVKPFVRGATNLLIGTALLGATASAINKL